MAGDAEPVPPPEGAAAQRVREQIRIFIHEHHPDHGGDPDTFTSGLANLRAQLTAITDPPAAVRVTVRPASGPLAAVKRAVRLKRRGRRLR